jgi:hypothetical protein
MRLLHSPVRTVAESPKLEDLIGAANRFATLPELLSDQHEGGLLPVELANEVAS